MKMVISFCLNSRMGKVFFSLLVCLSWLNPGLLYITRVAGRMNSAAAAAAGDTEIEVRPKFRKINQNILFFFQKTHCFHFLNSV